MISALTLGAAGAGFAGCSVSSPFNPPTEATAMCQGLRRLRPRAGLSPQTLPTLLNRPWGFATDHSGLGHLVTGVLLID